MAHTIIYANRINNSVSFLKDILIALGFLNKLLEFIQNIIENYKRVKEKTKLQDLSKKTETNIKEGNIDELNKNLI
jgi:hypothetical protein